MPLCVMCSPGVTVTLAGNKKDVSFRGKRIENDQLWGKVKPGLSLTFLNGGWKLIECEGEPA